MKVTVGLCGVWTQDKQWKEMLSNVLSGTLHDSGTPWQIGRVRYKACNFKGHGGEWSILLLPVSNRCFITLTLTPSPKRMKDLGWIWTQNVEGGKKIEIVWWEKQKGIRVRVGCPPCIAGTLFSWRIKIFNTPPSHHRKTRGKGGPSDRGLQNDNNNNH